MESQTLEGLNYLVNRLKRNEIPCFYFRMDRLEAKEHHAFIKTDLIPDLIGHGFKVLAYYTVTGKLTLRVASEKPLSDFYDSGFILTLLEWQWELLNEDVKRDDSALELAWSELVKTWSVAQFLAHLCDVESGEGSHLLTAEVDADWFFISDEERKAFKNQMFPGQRDRGLFHLLFKGYPIEAAMGRVCQFSQHRLTYDS